MATKVATPSLLLTPVAPTLASAPTSQTPTTTSSSSSEVVTPGERLCGASEYEMGSGTYRLGDYIYAAVVGRKRITSIIEEKKLQKVTLLVITPCNM
jgi:hypothetical protein